MRKLKGDIRRTSLDHRSSEGRRYTSAARRYRAPFREASRDAVPHALIALAARLDGIEIPRLESQVDRATAAKRRTEARRIGRQLAGARHLLLRAIERLEYAKANLPTPSLDEWLVQHRAQQGQQP
jgi:hypothetical protein